jgi:hypothetical protein
MYKAINNCKRDAKKNGINKSFDSDFSSDNEQAIQAVKEIHISHSNTS